MNAAMLASADLIKLGYVSRNHARDNNNHVLLQKCRAEGNNFLWEYIDKKKSLQLSRIVWLIFILVSLLSPLQ